MSTGERALRDELERLQTEAKGLETELSLDHAPGFLERRQALTKALAVARDTLRLEEKSLSTARVTEREAQLVVDGLDARGRDHNQQNLDLLPLLVLGAAGWAITSTLGQSGVDIWHLGFASGVGLGGLFGPRLLSRLFPDRAVGPIDNGAPRAGGQLHRSAAFVLSLFGGFIALGLNLAFWFSPGDGAGPTAAHLAAQVTLGAAALLALGGRQRAAPEDEGGRRTARRLALTSLVILGSVSVTAVPFLLEVLRAALGGRLPHEWTVGVLGLFLPWLPFSAAAVSRWQPPRSRPWLLGASLLSTLTMAALTFTRGPLLHEGFEQLTAAVGAVQLGLLGAVLGADAGKMPWPRARLLAIGAGLVGAAACLAAFFGFS